MPIARPVTGGSATQVSIDGSPVSTLDIESTTVTRADLGLGNVDNTADLAKPAPRCRRYATADTGPQTGDQIYTVLLAVVDFNSHPAVMGTTPANGIQALRAGSYLAACEIAIYRNLAAGTLTGLIQVNGTSVREFGITGSFARLSAAAVLNLAANDTVTLGIYTAGGNGGTVAAAPRDTGLTLTYLGA